MASGSTAPFSGEFSDLENVPALPEGVTPSEATEKRPVDGTSIKIDSNGDLAEIKPITRVYGSFENNSSGGWNLSTTDDGTTGYNPIAKVENGTFMGSRDGDVYLRLGVNNTDSSFQSGVMSAEAERTDIEVSDASELRFLKESDKRRGNGTGDFGEGSVSIFYDGVKVDSGFTDGEIVIDVSNDTGQKKLRFLVENDGNIMNPETSLDLYIDDIKVVKPDTAGKDIIDEQSGGL